MTADVFFVQNGKRMHHTYFFGCQKVVPLWWECLSWLEVSTALPATPKGNFLQISYGNMDGIFQERWNTIWTALTWCIWNHRNRVCFSNHDFECQQLLEEAIFFAWLWLRNLEKDFATFLGLVAITILSLSYISNLCILQVSIAKQHQL